jgi:hypothetical protein
VSEVTCWKCAGEGIIVVCWDDMCRGTGHCIHGDGEDVCPICLGDGYYLAECEGYDD